MKKIRSITTVNPDGSADIGGMNINKADFKALIKAQEKALEKGKNGPSGGATAIAILIIVSAVLFLAGCKRSVYSYRSLAKSVPEENIHHVKILWDQNQSLYEDDKTVFDSTRTKLVRIWVGKLRQDAMYKNPQK